MQHAPHFQLATFKLRENWAADLDSLGAPLRALVQAGEPQFLVVEVMWTSDDLPSCAVLVSIANGNPGYEPGDLNCWLAYANDVAVCDAARAHGFPMVEAQISIEKSATDKAIDGADLFVLRLKPAWFRARLKDSDDGAFDLTEHELLNIDLVYAVHAGRELAQAARRLPGVYCRSRVTPDRGNPADVITVTNDPGEPLREVESAAGKVQIRPEAGRYPDLSALLDRPTASVRVWAGRLQGSLIENLTRGPLRPAADRGKSTYGGARSPVNVHPIVPGPRGHGSRRLPRVDFFGPPDFLFRDVEIIGFRIDLSSTPGATEMLHELVRPLNFHLLAPEFAADFEYRVATQSVVIELLRYGQMRLRAGWPPLRASDFQQQHELLLRILVGRVDDDTAQARDAAIFVPAIFVDNPWSKALGREVQGFPKELAAFCVTGGNGEPLPLRMNGCLSGDDAKRPLTDVSRISRVERVGGSISSELLLLDLDFSDVVDAGAQDFESFDLASAAGSTLLSGGPWRQGDFSDAEFRRSFARPVLARGFTGFRSVQVSPVDFPDDRDDPTETTWVRGSFEMSRLEYCFPTGVVRLTGPEPTRSRRQKCTPWEQFWALLPEGCSVSTGNWYRARCSIELSINDGLKR